MGNAQPVRNVGSKVGGQEKHCTGSELAMTRKVKVKKEELMRTDNKESRVR
jgi:hypothetical protein